MAQSFLVYQLTIFSIFFWLSFWPVLCVLETDCAWVLADVCTTAVGPGGNICLLSEQFQSKLHLSDKEPDTPSRLSNWRSSVCVTVHQNWFTFTVKKEGKKIKLANIHTQEHLWTSGHLTECCYLFRLSLNIYFDSLSCFYSVALLIQGATVRGLIIGGHAEKLVGIVVSCVHNTSQLWKKPHVKWKWSKQLFLLWIESPLRFWGAFEMSPEHKLFPCVRCLLMTWVRMNLTEADVVFSSESHISPCTYVHIRKGVIRSVGKL